MLQTACRGQVFSFVYVQKETICLSSFQLHFTGLISTSRAESSPQTRSITAGLSSVNNSATPLSQPHSSSTNDPVGATSHFLFSSPDVSATPSSQILSSSGVLLVTASLVVLSPFPRPTLPSANMSSTASVQIHTSSGVRIVTSSYVALSSLLRPSTSELVTTSSVIAIPSGVFVRFGINVPLNQSVSSGSFKRNLEEGILVAYQNGSLDASSGNVSVQVS